MGAGTSVPWIPGGGRGLDSASGRGAGSRVGPASNFCWDEPLDPARFAVVVLHELVMS